MTKTLTGIVIERSSPLSLEELSQALHIEPDLLIALVEQAVIQPEGNSPTVWRFDSICFKRAKLAVSFHRDLEVNLPGIGLALDLLDQIHELKTQLLKLK